MKTIAEILTAYRNAGVPSPRRGEVAPNTKGPRLRRIETLLRFRPLVEKRPEDVVVADFYAYAEWRRAGQVKFRNAAGIRRELELVKLASEWALFKGRIRIPVSAPIPDFRSSPTVHCRDLAPLDAEELHNLALRLFQRSPVVAFQCLFEAFTGLRTSEALRLRWDAKPGEPGYIENGRMFIARAKHGVNNWVVIHPALAALLEAMRAWHGKRLSPWFFPSPECGGHQPIQRHALTRAIQAVWHRRITSHGMRSFYTTVRRAQGISDGQIAAEIGDATGASIITRIYGNAPACWEGGPQVDWLPLADQPAWVRWQEVAPKAPEVAPAPVAVPEFIPVEDALAKVAGLSPEK